MLGRKARTRMVHSGRMGPGVSQLRQAIEVNGGNPPPAAHPPDRIQKPESLKGAFFWRRVLARSIDLVFTIPFAFVLYIIVYIPLEIVRALTTIPFLVNFAVYLVVGQIIFLVAISLHDATGLALFGTTDGKSLFGIRVTRPDGRKPRFFQALARTEKILRSHFYLIGFPILMWPFVAATFSHIRRAGSATWDDRCGTVLAVRRIAVGYGVTS